MSMKPDVKKVIADIKATKGNRKYCNGLAGTLQDDNYASSICKYVKTVTPDRIDLLIEHVENLENRCLTLTAERDASVKAERIWEKSMMEACGEDGPASVASEIAALRAQRDTALESLRKQLAAVVAENAGLKDALAAVIDRSNEPDYQSIGMGCGVEDNGLQTDGYNACEYGWREAMERVYSEVIPESLPETPATDAYLAEVRAQGADVARNALITFVEGEVRPNTNVPGLILGAGICVSIAAQLRQGEKL